MQHTIYAVLKADHTARMAQVGESIIAKLAKGHIHKVFCHGKANNEVHGSLQMVPLTWSPNHH
jgi:hypothetical protein